VRSGIKKINNKLPKLIPVFLLTIKNSSREFRIRKKLDHLKINYKIFYAIDGKKSSNFETLDSIYNKKKCIHEMGRNMSYSEISTAEAHLRIYKHIIKQNISSAVIMEDDCHPSKDLNRWLILDSFFKKRNYDVIQIYHSFGLVYNRATEIVKNKFSIYRTCFTIPYATCYQISKKACRHIVNQNKLISRIADWPINFHQTKLRQFIVLPYIVTLRHDHDKTSFQKNIWDYYKVIEGVKKFIPFYNFITALFYLLHIPFILRIYKDYPFYKENYLLKKIFYIKNIFSNKYINLGKTIKNKHFYPSDLVENAKKMKLL
jgi:GR25 family glycosyltransferase involved in LPS biosynthesis